MGSPARLTGELRYWHGGIPGLRPGARILPPDLTRTDRRLSAYAEQLGAAAHATRTDIVYVTTVRDVARAFAAFYPDGALYAVRPVGAVEPDPDCSAPGVSWQCAAAEILSIVDPVVLFRDRTPERWLRLAQRLG